MAANGRQEKSKFNATTGQEGSRIGVDKEDRSNTEHGGTCVIEHMFRKYTRTGM
jgi:hypothetical protein